MIWQIFGNSFQAYLSKSFCDFSPSHPKQHPLAAAEAMFYDKQPRFGWRGVCHRALWERK